MDSATQFLLGASIAGAMMGRQVGPRILLVGGIVATLPDLDSFIPTANAIDNMTEHRGPTHSLILLTAAAPLVAYAVKKMVPAVREHSRLTLLTIWLVLFTHPLLDSLTTYGTQILWPLSAGPPVAFSSIFIIDPTYTSLLLIGSLCFLIMWKNRERGLKAQRIFLALSVLYLCVGIAGQVTIAKRANAHPAFQGKSVFVQPTPFNNLFWQVLAVDENGYTSGLTGLLPGCPIIDIREKGRNLEPPDHYEPGPSARRLEWFTSGFYTYRNSGDRLVIADLRIGYDPYFVFSFKIAEENGDGLVPTVPVQLELSRGPGEILDELYGRIKVVWSGCTE